MQITLQGENNKTDRRNWRIFNGSRASRQARIQKEFFCFIIEANFSIPCRSNRCPLYVLQCDEEFTDRSGEDVQIYVLHL